jgi:hypothetical protein
MTVALRPRVSRACCVVLMGLQLTGTACGRSKDPERELASPGAERLVGIWTLRLTRTKGIGLRRASAQAETLPGTVALIESRTAIGSATVVRALHVGSFDADLGRWGLPRFASGAERAVIGRTWGDSVELVLGPDGSDRVMRLRGEWGGGLGARVVGGHAACGGRSDRSLCTGASCSSTLSSARCRLCAVQSPGHRGHRGLRHRRPSNTPSNKRAGAGWRRLVV